ncbi:hypothetical protein ABPG75_000802 [Micractinium tetrahymenae]
MASPGTAKTATPGSGSGLRHWGSRNSDPLKAAQQTLAKALQTVIDGPSDDELSTSAASSGQQSISMDRAARRLCMSAEAARGSASAALSPCNGQHLRGTGGSEPELPPTALVGASSSNQVEDGSLRSTAMPAGSACRVSFAAHGGWARGRAGTRQWHSQGASPAPAAGRLGGRELQAAEPSSQGRGQGA